MADVGLTAKDITMTFVTSFVGINHININQVFQKQALFR